MKAQKITKEVIENLPLGKYAIFSENKLITMIRIYKIANLDIKWMSELEGHGHTFPKSLAREYKDCYIVPASEVKLK